MDYFSILQLEKEPFSNSPDPAFFFKSRQHQDCLQKIELALRLKRGLNVVMGEVGTGKTTLCRQLIRRFQGDAKIDTHLILDPGFATPKEFLATVAELLSDKRITAEADVWRLKEVIKKSLYKRAVDEGRTIILIFDEGQKLPAFAIELLRELLNYETNTEKLLQIAIFAQCEFEAVLAAQANFADRINLLHRLKPMSFKDTREMIRFRLRQSSTSPKPLPLFTYPATWAIYRFSRGYPRKIIHLCHQSLLAMIIQNRTKAGLMLVRSCVQRAISRPAKRLWRPLTTLLCLLLVVVAVAVLLPEPYAPLSHLASGWRSRPWVSVYPVGNPEGSRATAEAPGGTNGYDSTHVAKKPDNPTEGNPRPEVVVATTDEIPSTAAPIGDAAYMDEPQAVVTPDPLLPAVSPSLSQAGTAQGAAKRSSKRISVDTQPIENSVSQEKRVEKPLAKIDDARAQIADTDAATALSASSPPLLLGRLAVSPGDTIVQLVRQVRGNYDPRYLDSLLALNPHIKNADTIAVNDMITFPAIPVRVSPLIHRTHWLQLVESAFLGQAHEACKAYRQQRLSVQLVPYWTAQTGLRFVVVAAEAFASPEAAQLRMASLPAEVAAHSSIRNQWGRDPIFFASPF